VLGVRPVKPVFAEVVVEPQLGRLERVEGTVPTPKGLIRVKHIKTAGGKVKTEIEAPEGIKIVWK
ncbi:MAG: alpha-L-rhamnosidase, partial [Muribaculaceae bacterium]|nr:alpha-L-rhamnosidase [Muribaculaceae bacterium]